MTTFTLRVIKDNSIRRFELIPGDVCAVGRSVDSNIHIPDPSISRHQLTLRVGEQCVDVAMNPDSPNQIIKSGRHVRSAQLFPGEAFAIGPYQFELEAAFEDLAPAPNALPPDPAGAIDLKLAEEQHRIAPRWSTAGSESAPAVASPGRPAGEEAIGPLRRIGLPAAALAATGLCDWLFLAGSPAAQGVAAPILPETNLLAAVQAPSCGDEEACVKLARDRLELADKLRRSGARDLTTLYRATKLLHQAILALDGREDLVPDLKERYRRARADLNTMFNDLQFRAERARIEHDPRRQMAALKSMLVLCEEDRLPMCTNQERIYRQLREQSAAAEE